MTMLKKYNEKKITVEEAIQKINSGDHVVSGLAAAEPKKILEKLHLLKTYNKESVIISTCLPMGEYKYFMSPEYKKNIFMEGWFYSATLRKAHREFKNVSYIPNHLHLSGHDRLKNRPVNVYIGNASPMDAHGFLSLGVSATYERMMVGKADIVILEVNPNVPRSFGDTTIHLDDVDYIIETDYQLPILPNPMPSDKDMRIGESIAKLVEDGSTIQLGIGGIPNAVSNFLKDKKDLGIHTEMLTDGMVELVEAGVVTNRQKNFYPNKIIATFALGSQKLYDFVHDNPGLLIKNGNWVNDPAIIGKNDKMVSINTTMEIDLTGQCCSESIGHKQFSGTGGQADTAIGAQRSKGGKSIIALYSTANIRQKGTEERVRVSKIVPMLKQGANVTLSRNDVDYVVTEYGVAALTGASVRERAKRLIEIAHPDYREELRAQGKALGYII